MAAGRQGNTVLRADGLTRSAYFQRFLWLRWPPRPAAYATHRRWAGANSSHASLDRRAARPTGQPRRRGRRSRDDCPAPRTRALTTAATCRTPHARTCRHRCTAPDRPQRAAWSAARDIFAELRAGARPYAAAPRHTGSPSDSAARRPRSPLIHARLVSPKCRNIQCRRSRMRVREAAGLRSCPTRPRPRAPTHSPIMFAIVCDRFSGPAEDLRAERASQGSERIGDPRDHRRGHHVVLGVCSRVGAERDTGRHHQAPHAWKTWTNWYQASAARHATTADLGLRIRRLGLRRDRKRPS